MKKVCCDAFKRLFQNIGKKGWAILPEKGGDLRFFVLQFRMIDYSTQQYLSPPWKNDVLKGADGKPLPITLSSSMAIHFCPSCGQELAGLMNYDHSDFDKEAEKYRQYLEY